MPKKTVSAIKKWIKSMGFKLTKSYVLSKESLKINYYSLGNFGIYEEIFDKKDNHKELKFVSWNAWGEDFEVNDVTDLSEAYRQSLKYNPEIAL